jgi:hypothetical protein
VRSEETEAAESPAREEQPHGTEPDPEHDHGRSNRDGSGPPPGVPRRAPMRSSNDGVDGLERMSEVTAIGPDLRETRFSFTGSM